MASKPDLPCADCGKLMWRGSASLPEGQARCHPCRREHRPDDGYDYRTPCTDCGEPSSGQRCWTCAYGERGPSRKNRQCQVCGDTYNATYADQRTCSRECGVIAKGHTLKTQERVYFPICWVCGQRFTTRSSRPRLCNKPECRSTAAPAIWTRPTHRTCDQCGSRIKDGAHSQRRFCSDNCRHRWHADQNNPRVWQVGACQHCRCQFITNAGWSVNYCTRRCNKNADKRRRRALKLGIAAEPYTLAEIAERDSYRCQLCQRKVNMKWKVPNPRAATIDHVTPLALGGDDTKVNVQLAHFICNSAKRHALDGDQLALFG